MLWSKERAVKRSWHRKIQRVLLVGGVAGLWFALTPLNRHCGEEPWSITRCTTALSYSPKWLGSKRRLAWAQDQVLRGKQMRAGTARCQASRLVSAPGFLSISCHPPSGRVECLRSCLVPLSNPLRTFECLEARVCNLSLGIRLHPCRRRSCPPSTWVNRSFSGWGHRCRRQAARA